MSHHILDLPVHLVVAESPAGSLRNHRVGDGVGEMLFQACCDPQHLISVPSAEGYDIRHGGAGSGESSCLVEDNGIGLCKQFQILSALYRALMFLVVAALYPRFGFCKRGAIVPGAYGDIRPGVVRYMAERGYELEKEEGENLSFRLKSPVQRALKLLWEDRITFTRDRAGFYVEGRTKDVVRIVSGLEARMRGEES